MGYLIALSILILLAFLLCSSVRANISYQDEMIVVIEYLFLKFQVYPEKPPKKGEEEKEDKDKKKLKIVNVQKFIRFVQRIIQMISGIIGDILKKCKIKLLQINIIVASEDAAQTAIQYGEVCAAVGTALGVFQAFIPPKKYDIHIAPDFTKTEFLLDLKIIMSLRLYTLLGILIKHGIEFGIQTKMKIKTAEGGTVK